MAFSTYPFALQNQVTDADLVREAVASLVPNGGGTVEPSDLSIIQTGVASRAVVMTPGRVWVKGTELGDITGKSFSKQGLYFGLNGDNITLPVDEADTTYARIDVVYVAVSDTFYGNPSDGITPGILKGTPSASPVVPTALPSNALALGQYTVAANATSISTANITNYHLQIAGRNATVTNPLSPSGWASSGPLLAVPSGSYNAVSGTVMVQRTGANLPISNTAYTTVGQIIPANLMAPEQNSQYIRGLITGAGLYEPCTVFVNMQTGILVVRADAAVTMVPGSFVSLPVQYIQAS